MTTEAAVDRLLDHVVALQRQVAERDELLNRVFALVVDVPDRELTTVEAEVGKIILDFSLRTDALALA